jgi:hypothetical protein
MSQCTRDKYASLYERLIANTAEPEGAVTCWVWTGAVGKRRHREYPRINIWNSKLKKQESKRPHRVMIEIVHDIELTEDLDVDHKCLNTRCINPDHLEVVTRQINLQRRFDRKAGEPVHLPRRDAALEASIDHVWKHGGVRCAPGEQPPF